ncbi:sensor domain-containing diguanylate cyclase [Actinoplanes sp. NPDC051851]|uniref:sensor domain-containing diguanylate cyclase n=1 Tax=Actinoplanes sp. NPDC051851 TaxID=3154753 RepID=UPI00343DE881
MRFRTPRVALAGYALAAIWFVLYVLGVGDWDFQIVAFSIFTPLISAVPLWLAWKSCREAHRTGRRAARRHLFLTGLAWVSLVCSGLTQLAGVVTGDRSYPSGAPLAFLFDALVPVLLVAALLTTPVRHRWSSSKLRLGLDTATVMTAGAAVAWYFVARPELGTGGPSPLTLLTLAAPLVVIFAMARLVLGGVVEVSRRAIQLAVIGAGIQMVINVLQHAGVALDRMHNVLALRELFLIVLIAGMVAHLRKITHGEVSVAVTGQRPSSVLPYAAVAVVDALLVYVVHTGVDRDVWVTLGAALLATGLVVARQLVGLRDNNRLVLRVDASMTALREAMAREQILSDLGTAMLGTTEARVVHGLAADAAVALLGDAPNARSSVIVANEERSGWTVAHVSGAHVAVVEEMTVPADGVPAELLARIAAGATVTAPGWAALGLAGLDGFDSRPIMLLPLLSGERFFGVLTVAADGELPADTVKSLETLRTQVSLALESAALTAELTMRAMHDMLTGLGNRALLRDRLTGALSRARRTGRSIGVLLLDLNGFKPVNDTYGHDVGDMLLKVVADRLRECVRTEDTVARLGGDEFVVVTEDLRLPGDALVVAERIVAALNEPVEIDGHLLRTPASIGIALSEPAHAGPDDVLRDADTAMYVAKRQGGGRYHLHATHLSV